MTLPHALTLCAALLAVFAAAAPRQRVSAGPACVPLSQANADDCIRMNEIQVLGTHNSYHVAQVPAMLAAMGASAKDLEYTHRPLEEQLSALGVRQFELDVFADPEGGLFATPAALRLVDGLEHPPAELRKPGFKVLHVPDTDYRTTCALLVTCLTTIRDWSASHSSHLPILVLIEAKDTPREDPKRVGFVRPIPIRSAELDRLDQEIRSVFSDEHLITPDRVRGTHATLREAVQANGWPLLRAARGKVLFALDNTDDHRTQYLQGHPSLGGRVMFVSSDPDEPSAAFLKLNEALGDDEARIRSFVQKRYLIRTRADIPTVEARSGDTRRRDSAFRSGAQYVSTDYPEASPFGSGYRATLPGTAGLSARCNPVNAPAGCRDEWLEAEQRAPGSPH